MATSMTNSLDTIARVLKKWEAAYKNCLCTDTPDIQKLVKEALFESDVTKFKVTATDTYKEENFALRSTVRKADNDITVDWGDGTKVVLKSSDVVLNLGEWESDGEVVFHMKHTYAKNGDYDVTIYGKDYFCVSRRPLYIGYTKLDDATKATIHTLVSLALNDKYPLASCVTNLSWYLAFADNLKELIIPTGMLFRNIDNIGLMCSYCRGLLKVRGMGYKFENVRAASQVFEYCTNLKEVDYKFSRECSYGNRISGVYTHCISLKKDIKSFFGNGGFKPGSVCYVWKCFRDVPLTGTVPGEWLWEQPNVTFYSGDAFSGCPEDIRAQVPKTWGGTKE